MIENKGGYVIQREKNGIVEIACNGSGIGSRGIEFYEYNNIKINDKADVFTTKEFCLDSINYCISTKQFDDGLYAYKAININDLISKNKSCKYCKNDVNKGINNKMCYNFDANVVCINKKWFLHIGSLLRGIDYSEYIEIDNCPKCGKKLEDK